jgi:hypothetical protein
MHLLTERLLESAVLTPTAFLCLALLQAPNGGTSTAGDQPAGVRAELLITDPAAPAGTLVKARIRGAALARLTQNPERWYLCTAEGEEVAAWLQSPPASPAPQRFSLNFAAQQAAAQDAVLVIDRGEGAPSLNHVAPVLAELHYLGKVKIEASADGKLYMPCGVEQIICQQIRAGQVLSVNQIACEPGDKRYLRLSFSGGGKVSLQNIEGWYENDSALTGTEQDAALGPMRCGAATGQHIWPLILKDNTALLTAIAIHADAPATLRQVSVVRLDEDLLPLRTEASFVWAGMLKVGSLTREAAQTTLRATASSAPWAIVVEDEQEPALQLKSVQVWAADYWLYFVMPDQPALQLRFGAPATLALNQEQLDPAAAIQCGEFSELMAPEEGVARPGSAIQPLPADWLSFGARWWRAAAYGLAALIALGISFMLLRSRSNAGTG